MSDLSAFSQLYALKNESANNTFTERSNLIEIIEEQLIELKGSSDTELAVQVYGKDYNPSTYRSLKSRLKNTFVQDILTQSTKSDKNQLRGKRTLIQKEYAALQIAVYNSAVKGSELLASQLLKMAMKYEVSEVVVGTAHLLYYNSVFYRRSHSATKKFKAIYERYQKILALEREAKLRYGRLSVLLKKKNIDHGQVVAFCNKSFELKTGAEEGIQSFDSNRMFYLLKCIGCYFDGKFQAMDESAQEVLDLFESLPFRSAAVENQFKRFQVRARLLQGEYHTGVEILKQIIAKGATRTVGWFNSQQLLVQIYLKTNQHKLAIESYSAVTSNRAYKNLPKVYKNDWLIMEAYLNFLQLQNPELGHPSMSRFRINRFINSNPELTESKKMYNIQLIVAQLLFYFHDQKYDKIEERISAITRYTTRYLKKNETYRSQVFIKMLAEIPRNNYSRIAIQRHTKKFTQRLLEHPSTMDVGIENIEIIPYEQLWEMILEKLKR